MKNGQALLIEVLRDTLWLAENNPCKATDGTLMSLAKGMKAFLSSEVDMDMSRERTARFLNMSTRSLTRKVKAGLIPKPERKGHKAVSFSALSLANVIRKLK